MVTGEVGESRRAREKAKRGGDLQAVSRCGTMKHMKLGSKPDVFQTEGSNIRLVDLLLFFLRVSSDSVDIFTSSSPCSPV